MGDRGTAAVGGGRGGAGRQRLLCGGLCKTARAEGLPSATAHARHIRRGQLRQTLFNLTFSSGPFKAIYSSFILNVK